MLRRVRERVDGVLLLPLGISCSQNYWAVTVCKDLVDGLGRARRCQRVKENSEAKSSSCKDRRMLAVSCNPTHIGHLVSDGSQE